MLTSNHKKGVIYLEPILKAFCDDDLTEIMLVDVDIKEHLSNKGYGTILLSRLLSLAKARNILKISGWISRVDKDHIERLTHFCQKHGFKVILHENENNPLKIGDIIWVNN
ncbi:hypothetical protein [Bacillus thuringiensis]|uniref:N-acetyltransferase domain-containing protein n=1 Tax=Bacillus thuringiensis TaxID=1428 RepID=A0AAW9JPR7_BACTU|nr:hypothetical protein [Bacillus thuringiensis]MDZ5480333.1 hypothetical protein [Bacillus thuringiensis]